MRYVLDSNVAIKWVLPEPDTPKAVQFRSDVRQDIHDILAPDIYPVEVAHALTKAERRGVIQPPQGVRRLRSVFRYPPTLHASLPLLPRAFDISSQARHGLYDCLYVALAEREGCELLTADQKLITNLGQAFPFIRSLASIP